MPSIRCGKCHEVHSNVAEVRSCYDAANDGVSQSWEDRQERAFPETPTLSPDVTTQLAGFDLSPHSRMVLAR
ncbi:MAG: hypothetical protein QOF60_217 [Actinomycetota bacterium]|jgi:hypothetical protein|nr:hypothetical protein [Actinomycetota bacterium]